MYGLNCALRLKEKKTKRINKGGRKGSVKKGREKPVFRRCNDENWKGREEGRNLLGAVFPRILWRIVFEQTKEHSPILCYDNDRICKIFVSEEL